MDGVFITFEGGDGGGKSTQIARLQQVIEAEGRPVLSLREPGGSALGTAVRKILLTPETGFLDSCTELLLFSAARRELVTTIIRPALEEGHVILCDRFADSTMAYQGYGRGLDKTFIDGIARRICGDVWPVRTILLDAPVEVGRSRAVERHGGAPLGTGDEDRFEIETTAFHQRVREGFLAIAAAEPDRVKVVDATADEEAVAEAVQTAVVDVVGI